MRLLDRIFGGWWTYRHWRRGIWRFNRHVEDHRRWYEMPVDEWDARWRSAFGE